MSVVSTCPDLNCFGCLVECIISFLLFRFHRVDSLTNNYYGDGSVRLPSPGEERTVYPGRQISAVRHCYNMVPLQMLKGYIAPQKVQNAQLLQFTDFTDFQEIVTCKRVYSSISSISPLSFFGAKIPFAVSKRFSIIPFAVEATNYTLTTRSPKHR